MESIWMKPELADEIINNKGIFDQTHSIVTDVMSGRIGVTQLVENMAGVLTNKEAENREKGMLFFTKLLKELPKDYLDNMQVKFISKFYVDRLKDNHRVVPAVLDGYLVIIDMKNYEVQNAGEFFTILFREVVCQSQLRQDRYNIYRIIEKLLDSDLEYNILEALWHHFKFFHNMTWEEQQSAGDMKTLGPDYVYGIISAMDGERDPRNLLLLFSFLPKFISQIPLGHLVDEMFEVISCYYPVDFHPSPEDPAAVTRQELANALMPCLCAIPEFGEHCLVLLIEKLDSSLRTAKIDSLKLLTESCKTFKADSYGPFLKALWSSIHREISNKTDEELQLAAHEALSTLVATLSITANTDPLFEHFIQGILIAMQTAIAESNTVAQYVQATRVLLTTANASEESCTIITACMIPATLAFYGFKTSPKLQITSLDFLGNLYDLAKHWNILSSIEKQLKEIPQLCLTAVSQPAKEFQIAGFKTLMRINDVLDPDLMLPFVEVLIHNVQHCQDNDLLTISVETIHVIARKHPELIMSLVVHGRCSLRNLTEEKAALQKRLNLLCNLASIDDFTKIIIEEMLKLITSNDKDASKVVEALSATMSNSILYSDQQLEQIESDHGLIDSILSWLNTEIELESPDCLTHGYILVANTIGSLPAEKQQIIISKHGKEISGKCGTNEVYYLILESLYSSVHNNVFDSTFPDVMSLSLKLALSSENDSIRTKACGLIANFLNKVEYGPKLEHLYELLTTYLSSCSKEDQELCPRLIVLYGWITKALIMRSSDTFLFWLQKVTVTLSCSDFCRQGSEAIHIIMTDFPDYLTSKQHCRISQLYKQRMYQTFSKLTEKLGPLEEDVKESYLTCWAFVLAKTPKSLLITDIDKIAPLVIESLEYDNKDLLLVMLDVLSHFVQAIHVVVADSLQTILPRLVNLSKYVKSMDVRIKSLQCLYDIANSYRTMLLLPNKQDILLDLAPSLDDKKRLVRNVAVKARTRWFLIGAPGESKEN